ncbi:MAG: Loki-CTERM sorting domain-containing protein [Promethearchaeati archaeon]
MGFVGGDGITIPGYDLYILFGVFITSFILIYLLSKKKKLKLLS